MGCGVKRRRRTVLGFTSGSAANDLFFDATGDLDVGAVAGALVEFEVVATSDASSVEIQRAYQLSQDGITYDTPVAFSGDSGFVSSLGFSYPTTQETLPVSKPVVRIGFLTNQKAGSDVEQVRVNVLTTLVPR